MLCCNPFLTRDKILVPCGKCIPCLNKRVGEWVGRMEAEALQWDKVAFITLTYSDETLPHNELGFPTLQMRDIQNFFKRIRKSGKYIRYFCCGEYGEKSGRPHYHAIIYGLDETDRDYIETTWGLGFVSVFPFQHGASAYVAKYLVKDSYDIKSIETRKVDKEFQTYSKGLGMWIVDKLVKVIKERNLPDCPNHFMLGDKRVIINRYYREKIRLKAFPFPYYRTLKQTLFDIWRDICVEGINQFQEYLGSYWTFSDSLNRFAYLPFFQNSDRRAIAYWHKENYGFKIKRFIKNFYMWRRKSQL